MSVLVVEHVVWSGLTDSTQDGKVSGLSGLLCVARAPAFYSVHHFRYNRFASISSVELFLNILSETAWWWQLITSTPSREDRRRGDN